MKVIAVDNFARDHVSDMLVCSDVNEYHGNLIVELLNKRNGESGPRFYRLVPDDHVLYTWEP